MNLQIGRLGINGEVESPESGTWATGKLDLTFHLHADTLPDLLAMRDQLYGMVNNPDELVVPVVADPDDRITGFWQVTDVSAPVPSGALDYLDLTCTVSLARIAASSSPLIESSLTQALRPNGASITLPAPWHAIPAGAEGYSLPLAPISRPSESGDVSFFDDPTLANTWVHWTEEPADHYDGAATIEVGACDDPVTGGTTAPIPPVSTYYPIVGRQMPNYTYGWRVSNGLVRFKPIYSSDTVGLIVEAWTGTRWSTPWRFKLGVINGTTFTTYMQSLRSVSIVRNSPEAVTLKIGISNDTRRRSELMITLRRGSYFLECYRTDTILQNVADHLAVHLDPSASCSTLTVSGAGVQASGADADGMRWGLMQADAGLGVTADGAVKLSSPGLTQDFMVALVPGGSSPSAEVLAYMACGGETVRVVGQ